MPDFKLRADGSVTVVYDSENMPFSVSMMKSENASRDHLAVKNWHALPHWHPEIEVVRALEGKMDYHVNSENFILEEGECLILNTLRIHRHAVPKNAQYQGITVLFPAQLVSSNESVSDRYVTPLLEDNSFDFIHLKASTDDARKIAHKLDRLWEMKTEQAPAYELRSLGILQNLWADIFCLCNALEFSHARSQNQEQLTVKLMVSYIKRNYSQKINQDDIAKAGQVCRSKCTRLFRTYFDQTPIKFLNSYRLEMSRKMLANKNLSVADVSTACGFTYQSYFCSAFKTAYGCSPKQLQQNVQV